jgi:predicted nucleic acid-binding protein
VYADSSFIVRLVTLETESEEAMAEYRRLNYPALFYLPLHALEVRNAILQRAFHQRRSSAPPDRRHIARDRDAALARLLHYLRRRALVEVSFNMESAISLAADLATTHTERLGARAIDLLHVASALSVKSEIFLTADARQALVAKAEGLRVVSTSSE